MWLCCNIVSSLHLHFRCPRCHGSQYRTSAFDISANNPFGAKCIFCKSNMLAIRPGFNKAKLFFSQQPVTGVN
ncbi:MULTISPECIES: cold shock small protein YmcF [Tenebrionibacter/Tenebrionicola group]|uniref:cold shock small protein YmcF n=1 Tax=Tenebrionibacter/Tenebrionicola group TaxID=2969848 RepID=UPI001EE8548C|nr:MULTISPECIES: hypothetical protein [Tenebrionibacter/Tenebrionicola group]